MENRLTNLIRKALENFEKVDAKIGFGFLERVISCNWFNPLLTFWVNLRSFPLRQAVRMPIFVYGRPKIFGLSGRMEVKGEVHAGMVKFNMTLPYAPSNVSVQSSLCNMGKIVFHGGGIIGTGSKIHVCGTFVLGNGFRIADMINICCFNRIEIGEATRIAHRSQVMDSNYHYIANFKRHSIANCDDPISIGKYCWICNTTTVGPGAVLPNHTIVSAYSLINKNFSDVEPYSLIGGIPAKFITSGLTRVWNEAKNQEIMEYFETHSSSMPIPEDIAPEVYDY